MINLICLSKNTNLPVSIRKQGPLGWDQVCTKSKFASDSYHCYNIIYMLILTTDLPDQDINSCQVWLMTDVTYDPTFCLSRGPYLPDS